MIKSIIKQILVSSNALVSLSLLVSIASGYISPNYLPILVLFGLGFPHFIFINICFTVFWIVVKRRLFLLSTITLVISLPLILQSYQLKPLLAEAESNELNFSVMSYNVRVFDLYNWSNNKVTRNNMFNFIRGENPDIACFQEYFNNTDHYFPVHDSLMKNQRFVQSHNYYNVEINNGHQFGIATYSIYPIIRKKEIIFENTHNLAIVTDIKINTDTIRVINCHLESVRFLESDYHFIDSITLLSEKRRIEGFKGVSKRLLHSSQKRAHQSEIINHEVSISPYPVMVCGDFNDTPNSYTYTTIISNLNDSFKKHKFGLGGTYHRFIPPLRIDYILHDDQFNCHHFKTIKNNYSDHFPILGQYSVKQ